MSDPGHNPSDESREQRRRRYLREYQKKLRGKRKRLELSLSMEEYERLRNAADEHGMKVATFAREALFAYLDKRYILPDQDNVRDLELAVRQIANNVIQIARRENGYDGEQELDLDSLHGRLTDIEDMIVEIMREPQEMLEMIEESVEDDEDFVRALQELITQYCEETTPDR